MNFVINKNLRKMSKLILDRIISNAREAENVIEELKTEVKLLTKEYNKIRMNKLILENESLEKQVELTKKKLISLEIEKGILQIPLPTTSNIDQLQLNVVNIGIHDSKETVQTDEKKVEKKNVKDKSKSKEKKEKQQQQQENEDPVDFGRLDLRVAKVVDVERHPDADSLYVLKINCGDGNGKLRTVCSGLVNYIPIEKLKDIHVILLCNLKPVKMRGILSEAMVMCASDKNKVEVLLPPPGVVPGDPVECDGFIRRPDPVMNPKKKIFETVAPDLHTNDSLEACYMGKVWNVPGKGKIISETLKGATVK